MNKPPEAAVLCSEGGGGGHDHWVKAAPIRYLQLLFIHPLCQVWWHHSVPLLYLELHLHSMLCTLLGLHNIQPLFLVFSQTLQIHAWPWTFGVAVSSSWNPLPLLSTLLALPATTSHPLPHFREADCFPLLPSISPAPQCIIPTKPHPAHLKHVFHFLVPFLLSLIFSVLC